MEITTKIKGWLAHAFGVYSIPVYFVTLTNVMSLLDLKDKLYTT